MPADGPACRTRIEPSSGPWPTSWPNRACGGTTINAVADRAGVARGTVYRRWPNRSAMIAAAIRASRRWDPLDLGEDLEDNIRQQAEEGRRVLAETSFQAMMPALMEMQLNGDTDEVVRSTVFPRRRQMAEMYARLAAEQRLSHGHPARAAE